MRFLTKKGSFWPIKMPFFGPKKTRISAAKRCWMASNCQLKNNFQLWGLSPCWFETKPAILHLKMDGWTMIVSFLGGKLGLFFRGKLAVSFRECKVKPVVFPENHQTVWIFSIFAKKKFPSSSKISINSWESLSF